MLIIGSRSVAYLNADGRQQLSGLSCEQFYALSEEEKGKFPPHLRPLLFGRPLRITELKQNEKGEYVIVLKHEEALCEFPYECVSAIFLP